MGEIARATNDYNAYPKLFQMLWKRLTDTEHVMHVQKVRGTANHYAMRLSLTRQSRTRPLMECALFFSLFSFLPQALILVEYLLRYGSERFIGDARRRSRDIAALQKYKHYDANNQDDAKEGTWGRAVSGAWTQAVPLTLGWRSYRSFCAAFLRCSRCSFVRSTSPRKGKSGQRSSQR
jgi:hypothetical protein